MKTVDVGAILDDGHFGGYQKLLVFATALTIILDGFDNQVMGGAIPLATAISSEYVPRRKRPVAVTLTVICVPLGGAFAGWIGGYILPRFGWRVLFFVGGMLPLVLAAVLFKILPESPRYMARIQARWG